MNEYLLMDGTQIPVLSELAQVVGLNEAIVLQEVYYWCKVNRRQKRPTHDGYYWVYNSYAQRTKNHFPWWNEKTVKNTFTRLENRGLLVSGNFNDSKMDRTKWYRVNFPVLRETIAASGKFCPMDWAGITQPIPDIIPDRNDNGIFTPQAAKNTPDNFSNIGNKSIDIPSFIQWYYDLYKEEMGKPHPRLKPQQEQRVTKELTDFLNDPEFCGIDTDGLQAMARDFFDSVDNTDGNINHFATRGILKCRSWNVFYHGYGD